MKEETKALVEALAAYVDARLAHHGILEEEAAPEPEPPPATKGKGKNKTPPPQKHTREELREKMVALVERKDKQAAMDVLTRFGCKKLADLRPEQVDDMHEYLTKLEENGEDPGAAEDPTEADELFG